MTAACPPFRDLFAKSVRVEPYRHFGIIRICSNFRLYAQCVRELASLGWQMVESMHTLFEIMQLHMMPFRMRKMPLGRFFYSILERILNNLLNSHLQVALLEFLALLK